MASVSLSFLSSFHVDQIRIPISTRYEHREVVSSMKQNLNRNYLYMFQLYIYKHFEGEKV